MFVSRNVSLRRGLFFLVRSAREARHPMATVTGLTEVASTLRRCDGPAPCVILNLYQQYFS